jgi:polysaccharide biosynthesis transport protein
MNNQKPDISPHLAEYYYILSKHKWIIIGSLIIMVTLTMFFTFRMKPVYRSTATLVIDKEQSKSPLTGERMDFESYVSQSLTFNTHFKLITSRQVLEEVIRRLKLDRQDEDMEVGVFKEILAQVKENIRLLLDQEEKVLTPDEQLTGTVQSLHENLDIEEVRDTRLLKISVEDHDPALSMDIANSLANAYIEFNIANRLKSSKNTLSWMSDQLYEMKKKLEDSEEAFLAYKQRENLFSVEGKQKVIAQKIADFNDAQLEARNKRLEVAAKLQQLKRSLASGAGILNIRSLIGSPLIENLNSQLLDAEVELSRLSKVYKPKHPKIVQIKTKIEKTRKKLTQEVGKEIKSLEAEQAVLLAREKAMGKTIADFDQEALSTNRKELKYSILQRSVTTNQKLYDTLLSKVEESNVVKDADVSNIRIVERAVLPLSPVKPKKKLNLALSIIFGLMTGVGLAFLLEYMDRSLRTEEDVQRYMDLPVLSVVPEADKAKSKAYGA